MRSTFVRSCQSPMASPYVPDRGRRPGSTTTGVTHLTEPGRLPESRLRPMSTEYPMYALSEEHQAIREAVRAVCDAKVAPFAADVDEKARYPEEAAAALQAADFAAPHVPEAYGGAGADALATCIVIEEVARADMAASLIPAVNKLGSMPVILSGGEEIKKKYLTKLAAGEGGFSYCLSEPDAGSDAAGMKTTAKKDGDGWVLNGVKRWITNAGVSDYY